MPTRGNTSGKGKDAQFCRRPGTAAVSRMPPVAAKPSVDKRRCQAPLLSVKFNLSSCLASDAAGQQDAERVSKGYASFARAEYLSSHLITAHIACLKGRRSTLGSISY
ncbi:hypothetical protein GGI43DRAFT_392080 [Trichoderma evansii]